RVVESADRRHRQPRRVEIERLGGDPPDQLRIKVNVKPVEAPAPAHLAAGARGHQYNRSDGGRYVLLHALKPQIQFLRWPRDKDEPVMRKGGCVVFPGGRRTESSGLQPTQSEPVARRN